MVRTVAAVAAIVPIGLLAVVCLTPVTGSNLKGLERWSTGTRPDYFYNGDKVVCYVNNFIPKQNVKAAERYVLSTLKPEGSWKPDHVRYGSYEAIGFRRGGETARVMIFSGQDTNDEWLVWSWYEPSALEIFKLRLLHPFEDPVDHCRDCHLFPV